MKTSITQEGLFYLFVVLAILVGSMLREVNTMLLFASFLCAPAFIAFRMGRKTIKGVDIKRIIPAQIFAGESFIVVMEVANPRPARRLSLSCWGLVVIDRIRRISEHGSTPPEKPYEPAVYFSNIPNGQTRQQTYAGNLPQRGRYRFEQVQISTRFPFGFFWSRFAQMPSEKTTEFFVYPKIGKLSNRWKSRRRKASESQQRLRYRPSRHVGDFLGVRPWQYGDTKKGIHWRASAKHQSPVVRQYELHQNQDCTVILDLYYEPDALTLENFELAVSFTATLVSDLSRRSEGSIFFATSAPPSANDEEYVYAPLGFPAQDQILKRLTVATPSREDHLGETLLKIPAHHQSEIIFVTTSSLDIQSSPRFKEFCEDSRYRGLLKRFRIVNTADEGLAEIFSV